MKQYILFNPLAGNSTAMEKAKELEKKMPVGGETEFVNFHDVKDIDAWLKEIDDRDRIILAGGDGTLNFFINHANLDELNREIMFLPCGSGNDFFNDIRADQNMLVNLNKYISNLPVVTVNGKSYKFMNNVAFGIDGYVCEEGDRIRKITDKPLNYTTIALKGLLYKFKPRGVKITVDGTTVSFKKAWMAPVMNGRFMGGGMKVTPDQDRMGNMLTCCVVHDVMNLKLLSIFPKVFKGTHTQHEDIVKILKGHTFTVEYEIPTPVQIDGEVISGVSKIEVTKK